MTFGDFAFGLVLLCVLYYVIVIAADYYKLKRLDNESSLEDQEIDISGAVEKFTPVDASIMLNELKQKGYTDPADAPDEDDNEAVDIAINNQEGIAACNLAAMFANHAAEASLFENCEIL